MMEDENAFERKNVVITDSGPYVDQCPIMVGAGSERTRIIAFECTNCKLAINYELEGDEPFVICSGKFSKMLKRYINAEKKRIECRAENDKKIKERIEQSDGVAILYVTYRGGAIHVDGCPIKSKIWNGISYANVMDDCSGCEYLVNACLGTEEEEHVLCGGFSTLPKRNHTE